MRVFFASRAVLTVLFLALVALGVVTLRALMRGWEAAAARAEAERRVGDLTNQQRALSQEIEDFKTGRGVEREAREKLNLRKLGEEVVIIQEKPRDAGGGRAPEDTAPLWDRLWAVVKASLLGQ